MKRKKNIKPEKLELIKLSQKAKAIKKTMLDNAKSEEELLAAASVTINYILIGFYTKRTGHSIFKTFKEWQDEGYTVNKGEKSFRVWSAPRKGTKEIETTVIATGEVQTKEDNYEFWGMCCLFHDGQVSKAVESEVA